MSYLIRKLQYQDIRMINQLYEEIFIKSKPLFVKISHTKVRDPVFWNLYLKKNSLSSFCIEEDNRMIGFCFSHIIGDWVWLGPVGIHPVFQNKGYGKALLNRQEEEIFFSGKKGIILESKPNIENIAYYTRLGYINHDVHYRVLIYSDKISHSPYKFKWKCFDGIDYDQRKDLSFLSERFGIDYMNEMKYFSENQIGKSYSFENDNVNGVLFFVSHSTYLKENPFLNIKLLAMNTTDLVEIRDVIFSIARHFLKKGYGYTVFTLSMNYLDLLKLIPKNVGKLVYNNFVFQKGNHQFINKCNYFYSFSWTG